MKNYIISDIRFENNNVILENYICSGYGADVRIISSRIEKKEPIGDNNPQLVFNEVLRWAQSFNKFYNGID